MKNLKFITVLALVFTLLTTMVACGETKSSSDSQADNGTTTASSTDTAAKPLDEVTLKIFMPGDRPADMDKVLAEAEAQMKDSINVKLNVSFISWADLKSKTQVMLAAGEDMDLIFDAPWNHMNEMIASGYYEPLDELIQKYGPNLISTRSELMINSNKVEGKIYGLPLGVYHGTGRNYLIRKDIREKLGLAPIKTYDDLKNFLYLVKEKEPSLIPISTNKGAVDMSIANVRIETDYNLNMKATQAMAQSMVLNIKNNDGKVLNLFDEMDPTVWQYITDARKLYTDKIVNQDLLSGQDGDLMLKSGKAACIINNDIVNSYDSEKELQKAVPTATLEAFTLFSLEPKKNVTNFQQSNFQFIPKISKNKERSIMFLDWANASQEHYDLLAYGIKGTNWEPVGDRQYKSIGTAYAWFPYAWIWNPKQERMDARWTPEEVEAKTFCTVAENFTPNILTGFTFDATKVANEIALYSNLESKYYLPLMNGMIDPDKNWEAFKKEGAAPVKKIQEELQSQIDKFLAAKK